jgi:CubicO group peptidase (beta-lactamase class C family)
MDATMPMIAIPVAPRPSEDKFGYGFLLTSSRGNEAFTKKPGSFSWAGIFNTYYWVDPSSGISAVILMQVLPFGDKNCLEILSKFENLIYQNLETK